MIKEKAKGNIMIIIIFMLITAAVIGLLVMGYVRNMMSFSNNYFSYNKAYYLAQGGLELQLTKAEHRGVGYQDEVDLSEYYPCYAGAKGHSKKGRLCSVHAELLAQGDVLTTSFDAHECTPQVAYHIGGGDAVGFPIFYEGDVNDIFSSNIDYISQFENNFTVNIHVPDSDTSKHMGFGIVKLVPSDNGQRDLPSEGGFAWVTSGLYTSQTITRNDFPWDEDDIGASGLYYFVIFNPQSGSSEDISFCLETSVPISLTQLGAKSFATFRGVSVGLEARRTIQLPGFIFSTVVKGKN